MHCSLLSYLSNFTLAVLHFSSALVHSDIKPALPRSDAIRLLTEGIGGFEGGARSHGPELCPNKFQERPPGGQESAADPLWEFTALPQTS